MKTTIDNPAHKNIRIPEHTYIMRHAGQFHSWQNLDLISPRLNKVFNHLNSKTMKRGKSVSENALSGVISEENKDLLNNSNSNVMKKTKKVASTLAFVSAFLLAMNVGFAQEKTAKPVYATEVASSAEREVKPVISIPAKLAKAINAAKDKVGKAAKDNTKKEQTYYYFTVTSSNNVGDNPCSLSTCTVANFPTNSSGNPMPPTSSPSTSCNPGDYCCVLAFSEDNIELVEISTGVWVWRPIAGSPTENFEKRPTNPSTLN